ncbi:type-F conjugative transfer system pilin assembly protein TrbC [Celeribacter naphthalenivorans]|uniref:type-F conjugative transfer system pilin assembly protein TrbC n=1 Tax=Celeribacter naphthalenivorans TaxID=1614694 RepID=UPI001CFB8AD1|nr:type-F conjugative transfer system pilin assembly protein TrbC [Celeribacter naphthalenivorans]
MAHVAQAQLLRTLITAGFCSFAAFAFAQENETEVAPDYAPGATGIITAPIARIVRDAEKRGDELAEQLTIQSAQEGVEIDDLEGIRTRALNDPRVRKLLGVEDDISAQGDEEKYGETEAILFASFSMPKESLRQMMQEATQYGATIVFRGFVDNSVFETRAKLEEVFEDDEIGEAFAIDPTLFRRFEVKSVPMVVVLGEELDVCETPNCEADAMPLHDRLLGNIPLETALRIIAAGNGDASDVASGLLAGGQK